MKYIINIDKSSYGNPSEDLRQYEIDIDVLRRKGNVYDSLIIDDTARVIRRIEHKNGEDYILENPIIENLSMIKIELFQGVNYIYVTMDGEILSTSTIVIDYLLKNDFTETYPTVIEMHSAIEQSANNIMLQVKRKADADEIISLINLSPEEITIDSNRISLQGKEINLTSDNVIITSNNFSVNKNGDMTCTNANISGKVTATSGKIAGYTIDGNMLVGANIGMSGLSGEGWGFWAGSDTPNSAPFRVGHNGELICSNATITGGSLKIGDNFSVDNNGNMNCSSATITGGTISGTTLDLISNFSPDGIVLPSITIVQPTGSSGITEIGGNYINFSNDEIINGVKSYNTTINSKGITVAYSLDGTRITSSVINHDLIKYGNQLKAPNSAGIYLDQYGNIYTQQTATSGNWRVQNGDNVPLKVNWASNTVDFMDGKAYFDSDGDLNTQIILPRINEGWNFGIDSRRYLKAFIGSGGIDNKGSYYAYQLGANIITQNSSNAYFGNDSSTTGKTISLRGNTVRLYAHTSGAVYLGTSGSTAITSDENLKDIYEIDNKYIDFFNNLKPINYVYKNNGHRKHFGFGARQVEEALIKAGLTTEDFAGILKDKDITICADENGTDEDIHYDELYSLRYEEFITLNTMMIQKQAEEIKLLKEEIEYLKSKIG